MDELRVFIFDNGDVEAMTNEDMRNDDRMILLIIRRPEMIMLFKALGITAEEVSAEFKKEKNNETK